MGGNHLSEEQFSVALPSILALHFMDIPTTATDVSKSFLSVHWSGDTDLEDTRLWIQTCVSQTGLKATGDIMIYNAFELVRFNMKEAVFFGCRKSESSVQALLEGTPDSTTKWDIVRYHLDPRGEKAVQAFVVYKEIQEDILGLRFHCEIEPSENGGKHFKRKKKRNVPSLLTITTSNGFILVFNPLEEGGTPPFSRSDSLASSSSSKSTTSCESSRSFFKDDFKPKYLRLPRSVNNIRTKLNQSNPVVIGWRNNQMGRSQNSALMLVAGIRRDIFVWDVTKELPLR